MMTKDELLEFRGEEMLRMIMFLFDRGLMEEYCDYAEKLMEENGSETD